MGFTVIAENDISEWDDRTGELYHFPSRYRKLLLPGTQVIYYKGKLRNKRFSELRLSDKPHYFGLGQISQVFPDNNSTKNDLFAQISGFNLFEKPVPIEFEGNYIEEIPENRKSNYWRDGVREINKKISDKILSLSGLDFDKDPSLKLEGTREELTTIFIEGGKKVIYSSKYERNPKLRDAAIRIHGLTCQVCSFNFKENFGSLGEGFIHVHHLKPISEAERGEVNPENDLTVLCPNCHAMAHRRKNKVLSLQELKDTLNKEKRISVSKN